MKNLHLMLLAGLLVSCTAQKQNPQTIDFKTSWDTTTVLKNPDKGWYHHLHNNGVSKYAISNDSLFRSFPWMDHLYLRLAWSYLEPQKGVYDWHWIDEVVNKYVPLGNQI